MKVREIKKRTLRKALFASNVKKLPASETFEEVVSMFPGFEISKTPINEKDISYQGRVYETCVIYKGYMQPDTLDNLRASSIIQTSGRFLAALSALRDKLSGNFVIADPLFEPNEGQIVKHVIDHRFIGKPVFHNGAKVFMDADGLLSISFNDLKLDNESRITAKGFQPFTETTPPEYVEYRPNRIDAAHRWLRQYVAMTSCDEVHEVVHVEEFDNHQPHENEAILKYPLEKKA